VALDPRAIEAVFLDVGNTLVSMDFTLLSELLAPHGVAVAPAALARAEAAARPAVSRFITGGSSEWPDTFTFYVRAMLDALGSAVPGDHDDVAPRLVAALRGNVPTQRLWSSVLPGVPETLAALKAAGLTLVVVSNSDGTVEQGLATFGLRHHLGHVVDSGVVGIEKPDPAIFRHALALSGSRPERTLHVGDLYATDVVGARAGGVHAILLDPYGDWPDVDCERAPDLAAVGRWLLGRDRP
jgi:HAD superfamily hydrolase (TIGR01509 family)